ncbi:MAG: recombinase family protein [Pseudomonadota bacterium]|nr:recombinase family protein [Pseudomonadota bacterium]
MRVGYARIALTDSDPSQQLEALREAGCERVFTDEGINAGALKRPALERMLRTLRRGDVLVVCKLDRLGRSLSHLIQLTRRLADQGIGFRSLAEGIDTTAAASSSFFGFVDALAEFERSLIIERTRAGSVAARRRGVKAGRKPKLTPEKIIRAQRLIDQGDSPGDVAKSFDVSVATLYRHLPAAASNRTTFDLFVKNHENLSS